MVNYIFLLLTLIFSSLIYAEKGDLLPSENTDAAQVTVINDPTQPLGYKAKEKKKVYRQRLPVLQSIVLDNQKRRAIMNNKYYEVGQKIAGYKVSRIEKDTVYLVYRSKIYTISLYSNSERFTQ